MRPEDKIEEEIQTKGLTAPRLTPEQIDMTIKSCDFHVFEGTTLTVCALTLLNGYVVTGESAAASPENFDEEVGRKIAYQNARNKIWGLEGYALRQTLHEFQNQANISNGRKGQVKNGETFRGTFGAWFQPLRGASSI